MKISKVRGKRDGRIRLPFDVACRFFSVHDKLGFPKASQTVDWLLSQSTSAIEMVSDITVIPETKKQRVTIRKRVDMSTTATDTDTPSKTLQANKKELRISARARARERTLEKKRQDNKNSWNTWTQLENKTETYKSFSENETSPILLEKESHCEIVDQEVLEWSDAMRMWQDSSWDDCISHAL